MAYLDTGELPWDMDLFDKSIEVSIKVHVHVTYGCRNVYVWGSYLWYVSCILLKG